MIKHAWSLVFFTVLGQLGAGLYLMHKILLLFGGFSESGIHSNSRKFLIISLIISLVALLISFSHLGHPKNAIYALSNFRSSWLSREVFFLSAFIGIMLFEILFTIRIENSGIRTFFISVLGIAVSLALVYTMVRLYQLETVPSWNSAYTFFHFYNSALLGGALLVMLGGVLKANPAINYVVLALMIIQAAILLSSPIVTGKINYLPFLFYGVLIIAQLAYLLKAIPETGSTYLPVFYLVCFIAGLLIERYLFYASYKSVGI